MSYPNIDVQDKEDLGGSLPDMNTSEAILFGPAYTKIKSINWVWDEMEEYLLRRADSLDSQIMDREWAYDVLMHNKYLIFARSPPVNDPNKLRDLFTLRNLCKVEAGLKKVEEYRNQNIAWGRMKGIEAYVKGMEGRGISESEWKAATASYNDKPISYEYVHGLQPSDMPGEVDDWDKAMRLLMGGKEYDKLIENIFGPDAYEDPEPDEDWEQDEEEEEEEEDPFFNDAFYDAMDEVFSDPVSDAIDSLKIADDECSICADYWERMDSDDLLTIDILIGYAEAMP